MGIQIVATVNIKQLERAVTNTRSQVDVIVIMNTGYTKVSEERTISKFEKELPLPAFWDGDTVSRVTFAMRAKTLFAKFTGQFPFERIDGVGYVKRGCDILEVDGEMIRLILNSMTAHSFHLYCQIA